MTDKDNYFPGTKVFIALRTNMFSVENEHITLEYFGAYADSRKVLAECERWRQLFYGMPVLVRVNGYANWRTANNMFHRVALVEFPGRPNIQGRNWHVTLESQTEPWHYADMFNSVDFEDNEPSDSCDDIWIGYTTLDGKEKKWLRYDGEGMELPGLENSRV